MTDRRCPFNRRRMRMPGPAGNSSEKSVWAHRGLTATVFVDFRENPGSIFVQRMGRLDRSSGRCPGGCFGARKEGDMSGDSWKEIHGEVGSPLIVMHRLT